MDTSSGKQTYPRTRVVNIRHADYDVYIGRPTHWGNPFIIGRDWTREEVIAKYETYIRSKPELIADLSRLIGKRLGCWCKPLPCHGDVLVRLIEEKKNG